jgi:hypothetical protein
MEHGAPVGAADSIARTPIPSWVVHESYQLQPPPDAENDCVSDGVCRLLQDAQVDLTGPEYAWHYRAAQRVLTRTGAERAAHFSAEFDPAFQRLEVHFIRILRGEECIEHASHGAFQTLRRETNLERLVLNGRLTTSLLIPDVRVGDVIEVCITVYGSNPALRGKYAGWMAFDSFTPWFERRHRLLRPLPRDISIKRFNDPPECEVTVTDNVELSSWRIVGQKRRQPEALTPPWLILAPALQQSEFKNWNEVALLFEGYYQADAIPEELAGEIGRLADTAAAPAERAAEWLRFVQQKLRYFALTFGEGGMVPRSLEAIWSNRFGDCKDAVQLYLAGARRMDLDACAALVSTTHGPALNDLLPSPNVFNHCIVRLRLNGAIYWLDPTMQTQAGSLDNIDQPHAGWALPLTPETTTLDSLGDTKTLHVLDCEQELCIGPKPASPAMLERRFEYRFWYANLVRNQIANQGASEYAKQMLKQAQENWPNAAETSPMVISDDQVKNCITTIFTYEMRDCWKRGKDPKQLSLSVVDSVTSRELQPLNNAHRQTDIYLGRPRKVTSHLRVNMPCRWAGSGWFHENHEPGIGYTSWLGVEDKTIRGTKELAIDAWFMPTAQMAAYTRVAGKLRENVINIWARERFGKLRPQGTSDVRRIVWLVIWLLAVALLVSTLITSVPQQNGPNPNQQQQSPCGPEVSPAICAAPAR